MASRQPEMQEGAWRGRAAGAMRGQMIWFNEAKGCGFIRTADDERLSVAASGFRPGETPHGRCAGKEVTFERVASEGDARAVNVLFSSVLDPRRARQRHHRSGR
jgi:cold shock CspA family protein